jgi:hypothetical protein
MCGIIFSPKVKNAATPGEEGACIRNEELNTFRKWRFELF